MATHDAPARRHHRRSGKARREQQDRSNARVINKLLSAVNVLFTHRGNQPTQAAVALAAALQGHDVPNAEEFHTPPDGLDTPPERSDTPRRSKDRSKVCWHWTRGHCRLGATCGFQHPAAAPAARSPLGKKRLWRDRGEALGSSTPSRVHYSHGMKDDTVSHDADASYIYNDPADVKRNPSTTFHTRRASGSPGHTPATTPRSNLRKSEAEADHAFSSDLRAEAPAFVPSIFRGKGDGVASPAATSAATASAAVHYYIGDPENNDTSRDSESEAALTQLRLKRYKFTRTEKPASSVAGLPLFDCPRPSHDGVQEEDSEVQPGLRSNSPVPLTSTLTTSTLPSLYDFHETNDELEGDSEREITVNIKVPPSTDKDDVKVIFRRSTLLVQVSGHEAQPSVIDGELQGCIDPEASSWTLQGTGPDRTLCLIIEKSKGGIKWHRLLKQADTNWPAPAVEVLKTRAAASYSSNRSRGKDSGVHPADSILPAQEVHTPSPSGRVAPSSESGLSDEHLDFDEGSEDDSDAPFVDYGPESHEAYVIDLCNDVAEALENPKEEREAMLDSLMGSRSFLRAAWYEGKSAEQLLQDTVRSIRKKRQLAAPDSHYEEGGEPIDKVLIYSLPDIAKDKVAGIFAQYGNVVQCAKLDNGRALVFMKYVHEAKWIVTHLHKNIPQGLDEPIGCVYATPENIRRSHHRA